MGRKSMRQYEEQVAREPEHKVERTRGTDSNRKERHTERGWEFM